MRSGVETLGNALAALEATPVSALARLWGDEPRREAPSLALALFDKRSVTAVAAVTGHGGAAAAASQHLCLCGGAQRPKPGSSSPSGDTGGEKRRKSGVPRRHGAALFLALLPSVKLRSKGIVESSFAVSSEVGGRKRESGLSRVHVNARKCEQANRSAATAGLHKDGLATETLFSAAFFEARGVTVKGLSQTTRVSDPGGCFRV